MEPKRRSRSSMKRRMRCCMMCEGAGRPPAISEAPSSLRDGWSMSLAEVDRRLGEATRGAGPPAHQHEGEEAEEDRPSGR